MALETAGPFINGYEHETPADAWDRDIWDRHSRQEAKRDRRALLLTTLVFTAFMLALLMFRWF